MKNFRRSAALLATIAMTATLMSLAQTPASAATETLATRVVAIRSHSNVRTRSYLNISGQTQVPCSSGWCYLPEADPDFGQAVLQRRYVGTSAWGTVATDTTAGKFNFRVQAVRNTDYRVIYSGATVVGGSNTHVFSGATSANMRVLVRRNLNDWLSRRGGFYIRGAIRPGIKRYVFVERKTCASCKYRFYKRVLSTGTGSFSARLAAPRRGSHYYRAYVKADTGFTKSWSNKYYRVYRY